MPYNDIFLNIIHDADADADTERETISPNEVEPKL